MTPIDFRISRTDADQLDYVIGGIPLTTRIRNHERQNITNIPALGVVAGTLGRLLLGSEPDLYGDAIALYVCGHCGGYDGGSIGTRITRRGEFVVWDDIGVHWDYDFEEPSLYEKVRSFTFEWHQYREELVRNGPYD